MSTQELSASPDAQTQTESPLIEVGTYPDHFYHEAQATFVVAKAPARRSFRHAFSSPLGVLFLSSLLMVALVSFGLGASATTGNAASTQSAAPPQTSSSAMTTAAQATPSNVPNATQEYGGQPATYALDPDGAKHFTLTAKQVMWEVVKGQRVLAWTINGTVPGPTMGVFAYPPETVHSAALSSLLHPSSRERGDKLRLQRSPPD